MTLDERRVLTSALASLSSIELDLHVYKLSDRREPYNFDVIGRVVMGRRLLAELLGVPQHYMLPGECYDEESHPGDLNNFTPAILSKDEQPLNKKEKMWLQLVVLHTVSHINGLSDGDASSVRCIARKVAEVAGYSDLSHFRLMYEDVVKPLYLKSYQPLVD